MIVYLSALSILRPYFENGEINPRDVDCLASFYGISDTEIANINKFNNFILDSGAFSFLKGKRIPDWNVYIEQYADFINRHGINNFFELDIDGIVGLRDVEKLRNKLERLTGRQPIPVWHKGRGKDYFVGMCRDYPYVALGGIAIKEIPRKMFETTFPWFINKAHESNAKIHGLGYTSVLGLQKYHFDSVDSTTWNVGAKYGNVCRVSLKGDAKQMHKPNTRCVDSLKLNYINFLQWHNFQKYARIKL